MRILPGRLLRALRFAVAAVLLGSFAPVLHAQAPRTANDRVYSDVQASRGRALYQGKCATCHGEALEGKGAPPLAGAAFLAIWGAQPLSELAGKIRNTMPADNPGKLQPSETVDLVAYLLQAGKFPSGRSELSADETNLQSIVLAAPPAVAAPAAALAPAFPPTGDLNQLMRSILFPNSNIIFNVQTNDPGAAGKPNPGEAGGGFSWTSWGAGLYSGWQIVDYAAIALAESAPLLLTPGRRCQNGRPVPLQNADFQKYVHDLIDFTDQLKTIAAARDGQKLSDIAEALNNTCANCHKVYRDVTESGKASEGTLTADRCNPNPTHVGTAQ